jgi:hypothetical protein
VIPYDEIDLEIRSIVRLLNQREGISSICSCAGHKAGDEAEIGLRIDSEAALSRLFDDLPLVGLRGEFRENRPVVQMVYVVVESFRGRPLYKIRLAGQPFYAQRELLASLESALFDAQRRIVDGVFAPAGRAGGKGRILDVDARLNRERKIDWLAGLRTLWLRCRHRSSSAVDTWKSMTSPSKGYFPP